MFDGLTRVENRPIEKQEHEINKNVNDVSTKYVQSNQFGTVDNHSTLMCVHVFNDSSNRVRVCLPTTNSIE
jgi:hypothetical protein